jgi:hypothetical protein
MSWRFNAPPGWPVPPPGWVPPQGWTPDPDWPAAPPDWQYWVEEPEPEPATWTGPAPTPAPTAPVGSAPAPRRRGCGWALLVVVIVGLLLVVAAGVISAVVWTTRSTQTVTLTTEAPSGSVRISHSCGPISVREGSAGIVSTRAEIKYLLNRPTVTSTVEGDEVVVAVDCPLASFGSTVSLVVDVPPGGSVEARTSAGSVTATGVSSELTLSSSAGSVTATDVTSPRVSAESSAGSVSLSFAPSADPVSIAAQSSAGSVRITVPDVAGVAYNVDAGSSAGSTTVQVRTDPQSERTISARSSAGSVVVAYR